MATDPFALFAEWFAEARASETSLPEAMASRLPMRRGQPSSRMVLLKGHGPDGFVFFTNVESDKGLQLAAESQGRLALPLEVAAAAGARSKAPVEPVSEAEADVISPAGRGIRGSAPGLRTSRARWTAEKPSSVGSRRPSAASKARTCRARHVGAAIASIPSASNSGPNARTASTNAACSRATAAAGREGLLYP